jgi:hypothetical protein
MFIKRLHAISVALLVSLSAFGQPPPEIQKMIDEINSRPRYFWCDTKQAQFILNILVKVDGKVVGSFSIPVAKANREEIPIQDPQKIAEYRFQLTKMGKRKFRGISHGPIEGNFWVGLATDTEMHFGHSWIQGDKILLHEILPFTVNEPAIYSRSGVKIQATWDKL